MCLLSITLDILNFRIYTKQERGEEEENDVDFFIKNV